MRCDGGASNGNIAVMFYGTLFSALSALTGALKLRDMSAKCQGAFNMSGRCSKCLCMEAMSTALRILHYDSKVLS
jgi:hypothetical protein